MPLLRRVAHREVKGPFIVGVLSVTVMAPREVVSGCLSVQVISVTLYGRLLPSLRRVAPKHRWLLSRGAISDSLRLTLVFIWKGAPGEVVSGCLLLGVLSVTVSCQLLALVGYVVTREAVLVG